MCIRDSSFVARHVLRMRVRRHRHRSGRRTIGKRHSQDFVVGDRLEPFDASVSVPLRVRQSRVRLNTVTWTRPVADTRPSHMGEQGYALAVWVIALRSASTAWSRSYPRLWAVIAYFPAAASNVCLRSSWVRSVAVAPEGSATKLPLFPRVVMIWSLSSSRYARATVFVARPRSPASWRMVGSRVPGAIEPVSTARVT